MAETGDGTQGLAKKSTPVSSPLLPQGEKEEVGVLILNSVQRLLVRNDKSGEGGGVAS